MDFVRKIYQWLWLLLMLGYAGVMAQPLPDAYTIVTHTNTRDEGEFVSLHVHMEMMDKRGKKMTRETVFYRKYFGKDRKQVIYYAGPANIKGTAFLVYQYHTADKEDDQWLYLPALRRTKRITAANRGDYFLGTDFSYEDVKIGTKINEVDYHHKTVGTETIDGHTCYVLESTPIDEKTADELGYGKVRSWVDSQSWVVRKSEYWDEEGEFLKTIAIPDIEQVQDIWTPRRIEVKNHQTGHSTIFINSKIDYQTPLEDALFTEQALIRGL